MTVITAILTTTTHCSYSLVIILDIRDVETTVAIVYGRRAGMSFMVRSNRPGQVLLRDQMPPPVLFLNLDAAHAPAEENPERREKIEFITLYIYLGRCLRQNFPEYPGHLWRKAIQITNNHSLPPEGGL